MSFNGNYFCISYSNDRSFKMCCKSQDCENEVKVKLYLPDWHVHLIIFLQTKYIVHLWLAVFEELTMMKMWHKSLDREMISRQIWIHKHSLQCFFGHCVVKKDDIQYWFAKQKHHFPINNQILSGKIRELLVLLYNAHPRFEKRKRWKTLRGIYKRKR